MFSSSINTGTGIWSIHWENVCANAHQLGFAHELAYGRSAARERPWQLLPGNPGLGPGGACQLRLGTVLLEPGIDPSLQRRIPLIKNIKEHFNVSSELQFGTHLHFIFILKAAQSNQCYFHSGTPQLKKQRSIQTVHFTSKRTHKLHYSFTRFWSHVHISWWDFPIDESNRWLLALRQPLLIKIIWWDCENSLLVVVALEALVDLPHMHLDTH